MDIEGDVKELINEFNTANPYRLIKYLDIGLIETMLPAKTWGMTVSSFGATTIMVNSFLNMNQQRFTMAHELGHAIEHPGVSTSFLRNYSKGVQIPKIEAEANYFAFDLLLYGLNEYGGCFNKYDIVRGLSLSDSMARFIK